MCIIGYAPAGATIKADTIRYMFKGNPDGAGIMWKPTDKSNVEIRKGFMKVEDLLAAWEQVPADCEKAVHCRIATSGKISAGCCHPFPVRAKAKAMRAKKDTAPIALMHNGTIGYCTPAQGMMSDYSDTMLFASRILYPLQKQLDNAAVQALIEHSTTSRLLIFRANGEPIVLGDWEYEDGVYYSNRSYKPCDYTLLGKYSRCWNDYDDDGFGCYGYGYWDTKAKSSEPAAAIDVQASETGDTQDGDNYAAETECVSLVAQLDCAKDLRIQEGDTFDNIVEDAEYFGAKVVDYNIEIDKESGMMYLTLWVEGLPVGVDMLAGYQIERESNY